jgi:SAM-dependent methyltransferase
MKNLVSMATQCLINIREYELGLVLPLIPARAKVLEIGAGAGWQAKKLHDQGFEVEAIDIEGNPYAADQAWTVRQYDGSHIPYPDDYFDVAFSSNVLEHVVNEEQLQSEIKRVLKSDGIAIHILPTGSWRFWTSGTYYLYALKVISNGIYGKATNPEPKSGDSRNNSEWHRNRESRSLLEKLFPPRHGEDGNSFSELYLFSRWRWLGLFRKTGWRISRYFPNRLFYTGYCIAGVKLPIRVRHVMSYILGSSCIIYVLTK